ncbi:hypothetical protein AB0A63_17445 [Lentzea sp. NPDC042327]|uniref:hypothetical protein n=1 Tax=Lentzea sp. NPDC042327 TaxID=3154801 RepID=UPI0034089C06
MRVIDGAHRVEAARARGQRTIAVQWFDGGERDAFLHAVKLNVTHGLPLTRDDRKRAVIRILNTHPDLSDRAIALAAGLGAKSVAALRRETVPRTMDVRTGRDGRARPMTTASGRTAAAQVIRDHPTASLREIARQSGISVGTARDVRQRLAEGRDPVPERERLTAATSGLTNHLSVLDVLCNDPSFRLNEVGRQILQQLHTQLRRIEDWRDLAPGIPPHGRSAVAQILASCAEDLRRTADTLRTFDHRDSPPRTTECHAMVPMARSKPRHNPLSSRSKHSALF